MQKKRIYLSGPISGLDHEKAAQAFASVEDKLRQRYGDNVEIINPVKLCPKEWTWQQCMRVCIVALASCHYIHMLPGFERSEGARLEMTIAMKLGFGVCNDRLDLVDYECL